MSQRLNAGANTAELRAPVLPGVATLDDSVIAPITCAACRGSWSIRLRVDPSGLRPVVAIPGVSLQSRLVGVDQLARHFAASAGKAPPV
jgi:hypothetical protein